jgi:hypothetical protein
LRKRAGSGTLSWIEAGAGGEIIGLQGSIAKVLGKTQRSSGGYKLRANEADDLDRSESKSCLVGADTVIGTPRHRDCWAHRFLCVREIAIEHQRKKCLFMGIVM